MLTVKQIAEELGGIPNLAKICGVQYRLAYGYVSRNSLPAEKDVRVVEALTSAGSSITLMAIAKMRHARSQHDNGCHLDGKQAEKVNAKSECDGQATNVGAA